MKYIDINKDLIPYSFDITLKEETYTFYINYNYLKDFFTIDLHKNDKIVVVGEKLLYGKPLFLNSKHRDVPEIDILPYDLSTASERITFENLNKEVFLYLVGDTDELLD